MFAFGLGGTAHAASVVSGTFSVDIYNYNAGGNPDNADATLANVSANGSADFTITYTGALNFATTGSDTTILDFLESGNGTLSSTAGLDILATSATFQTTTLYVFKWNDTLSGGTIRHDDGISLYDDGVLMTIADAAKPTVAEDTTFGAVSGNLQLVYSSANGNPEVLKVSAVPIPAAAWLFAPGVLGLLGYTRKRKAAATA
jgi:hypothetical protein